MKLIDMNDTMPKDILKILNTIEFKYEKKELEEAYLIYEHKVGRLSSLTRNYSVKNGYYCQSHLRSIMSNYGITYNNITNINVKFFNDMFSTIDDLIIFDDNFNNNIKELYARIMNTNEKVSYRKNNDLIDFIPMSNHIVIPIDFKCSKDYLKSIPKANKSEWDRSDRIINSWVIHCFFLGVYPLRDKNDHVTRFLLNKNISVFYNERIFMDQHLLADIDGYYNAVTNFCYNIDTDASIEWFINTFKTALNQECEYLDLVVLRFYDLLEQFEEMELTISRNAEMLAALFCIDGVYLKNDISEYFAKDIFDRRTVNKILNILVEKKILVKEGKIYKTIRATF